jgi:tetratricopeptide (TPR) repeat protein
VIALAALTLAAATVPLGCSNEALARDIKACDSAIAAEKDRRAKASFLHARAYAWNERDRPDLALHDLNEALRLVPDAAISLHERAYTQAELGNLYKALRDANRDVALRPQEPAALRERAYVRRLSGDLAGAHQDLVRAAELAPADWWSRLQAAESALWLGRFEEAADGVDAAAGLRGSGAQERAEARIASARSAVALWRTGSGSPNAGERCRDAFNIGAVEQPNLIGDCTAAFLAARTSRAKAEYLTYRSLVWSVAHQDSERALVDSEVAAGLDPGNADMLVNLGGRYNEAGRYRAALSRLDNALRIKRSYPAYTARANARYGAGDRDGAFADAKKSFEIEANPVALWVLGDLAKDRGDADSAKLYWMGAYRMGVRDDRLLERLKSIGVADPEKEPTTK